MVGTGRGATAGVLFSNAEALEVLEKVDTLVVDKTGTLTEGKPRLVDVVPAGSTSDVLRLAAGLERASEHPLAAAIVDGRAGARRRSSPAVGGFRSRSPARASTGDVDGRAVALGNAALLADARHRRRGPRRRAPRSCAARARR